MGMRWFARSRLLALGVIFPAALLGACGGSGAPAEPQSPQAIVARVRAQMALATTANGPADLPVFDPATGNLTLPDVAVNGTMYGTAVLHHNGDGTFSLANAPAQTNAVTMSASRYAEGALTLASVMVNGHRFTNVVLQLDSAGKFALVSGNDPHITYRSSYESKNSIALDNPTIPTLTDIPNLVPESGELYFNGRIAFGDFFQDGTYSAIAFSLMFKGVYSSTFNPNNNADSPARLYILRRNAAGQWTDQTSALIKDGNRSTCVTPSFIEVADLNNDDRPDVVIACTGLDFSFPWQQGEDVRPYWVARQYLLLSQVDGSYKLTELPVQSPVNNQIYGHQSAVADIDDDGNADILFVDVNANETPFVMWGHGDGTFTQDMTRFPASLKGSSAYSIRAVPVNGKFKVFVSAHAPTGEPNDALKSTGTQVFDYVNGKFELALDLTSKLPVVAATGLTYDLGQDFLYLSGAYYGYFVDRTYANQAIIKFDATTGASTIVAPYAHPGFAAGSGVIVLDGQNRFVNVTSGCGPHSAEPVDFYYYACSFSVPFQ